MRELLVSAHCEAFQRAMEEQISPQVMLRAVATNQEYPANCCFLKVSDLVQQEKEDAGVLLAELQDIGTRLARAYFCVVSASFMFPLQV